MIRKLPPPKNQNLYADHDDRTPRPRTEQFEQIIDSLNSGVIAFDTNGVIIMVNHAARRYLRMSHRQLHKGMQLDGLQLPGPFVDVLRGVMASHRPLSRREIIVSQPDGSRKEIGLSASLLKGPHAFNGAVFLFVDMTERRRLERAAEHNSRLAQIGELTAGVVHEMRNPLTVISGTAELLQRKTPLDDASRKIVNTILLEAQSLEKLISQFLGFAKPSDLETTSCRPEAIAERAYGLCLPRARKKDVKLDISAAPKLPQMRADFGKLAQAIVNIVNNAIDAVPNGGHVTIHTRRESGVIVFEITDNGPGIHLRPEEDIFKPFFSKKESGTALGLGLAIVRRMATAHGGSASYTNLEEGGIRFSLRIPIEQGILL